MIRKISRGFLWVVLSGMSVGAFAQNVSGQEYDGLRTITTAMPFLTISPDARAGALGDAGVATSPDANSIYWNPAKAAFLDKKFGGSVSYTPWLRNLGGINDVFLSYLSGYYKLNPQSALQMSLNYFNLGNIQFTDATGAEGLNFVPNEFAISTAYSQQLSERLSVGVGIKFLHSNLSGGQAVTAPNGSQSTKAANGAAADLAVYYRNQDLSIGGTPVELALGAAITNLGPKVTYTTQDEASFLPTNLRLGTSVTFDLDPYNKLSLIFDANKLMVPSPPIYGDDDSTIVAGKNPDRSFFSGFFGSFADAPDGFSEELKEFTLSGGVEYWYNNLFSVRGGYFHENDMKGGRQYFTTGAGLRYQLFGLDFAYLIPLQQNHPLGETLRFTLHLDLASGANSASN
ncbi:hypothetical protein SAMN05421823_107231 [Catalinimonas alkaloidigena]|uniref:Type IX secretion system protein PorV domain-containing protein n=1 Tax=Catalinimonas alkaloidigena TaxID=1075417 RepID=A0A1G9M2M7_9BACT|nr:type IX secretion system outer membrane channel protein PorV [Catalinimonas alkaloidigena]SDL67945.1 hypothetical protein SAMN05421823_107231 [Catalinimonas alkaloidigena]